MIKILNQKNNIELSAHKIELSEYDEHQLNLKFVICNFQPNLNGVMLNHQTINTWISSLLNQPVVAKVDFNPYGNLDFTGHNLKVVVKKDDNGNEYTDVEFDTSAFGTYISVGIEEIDGEEFIVANAVIWRRFKNVSDLIIERANQGILSTSWEIAVEKSHFESINGVPIKVIDSGRFIGNALLGNHIAPAYPSAQVLQVASVDDMKKEFNDAIIEDILMANQKEGENVTEEKSNIIVEDVSVSMDTSMSELQDHNDDSLNASESNIIAKDTDMIDEMQKTIDDLKEKLNVSNASLVKASEKIKSLELQISTLLPYKEKFEKAEQEKIEAEQEEKRIKLSEYAEKSGFISKEELELDENIKMMISNIDESGIKALIAERFMKQLDEKEPVVEMSTAQNDVCISIHDVNDSENSFSVSDWLQK